MVLRGVYEILLEKDQDIFYEGDFVTGSVRILNTAEIKYKAITVEIVGTAVVVWSRGSGSIKSGIASSEDEELELDEPSSEHSSRQTLLNVADILSKRTNEELLSLEAGEHYFPFECKLPLELPSSFSGDRGWVRYQARLSITSSESPTDDDVKARKTFTVVNGLDLSFIPEAATKIEVCKYRDIGVCCTEGAVTCEWSVVRSGYVPGESIWIQGSVQNDSRKPVNRSAVSLLLVVDYKSLKKSKRETRVVSVIEKGGTAPGDMTLWNDPLNVPILPPTGLGRCQIIDINYQLEFKAVLEGSYAPIIVTKPIYIGTVRMSLTEMRSFNSALYGRPLASATSYQSLDPLPDTPGPAQLSLTDIIASVGVAVSTENPSAPDFCDPSDKNSTNSEEKPQDGSSENSADSVSRSGSQRVGSSVDSAIREMTDLKGLGLNRNPVLVYDIVRPPPFAPGHEENYEKLPLCQNDQEDTPHEK